MFIVFSYSEVSKSASRSAHWARHSSLPRLIFELWCWRSLSQEDPTRHHQEAQNESTHAVLPPLPSCYKSATRPFPPHAPIAIAMPASRRDPGGRSCAPTRRAASGVAATTRGCSDGRELAVGARARAAVRGRARGRAPRAGGGGAALPRLGRPRAHRLCLLPRELEPAQGMHPSGSRRAVAFFVADELDGSLCQFAGGSGILDGAV